MCNRKFHVIGISDSRDFYLSPKLRKIVGGGKVFSGGKRHFEIVEDHLPEKYEWIDVTVPLRDVFARYGNHDEIVVFASGDPLFFGFGATLMREFPEAEIEIYPALNSLQLLAHRLLLPYQDMVCVSLTGRPWKNLDDALIKGEKMIGVLTDRVKTPRSIARRMLEYGYVNYQISVGVALGNEDVEEVVTLTPDQVADREFLQPNCLLLRKTFSLKRQFGIPEGEFQHLEGRGNMITKMPVRLLSLSILGLYDRHTLWDIGFCTGSVSIEARLAFPHLNIISFEKRKESEAIMAENCRKFHAPGIEAVTADFFDLDLRDYPAPDAVFIGGHGGRLSEMLIRVKDVLLPGGCIVFNSVSKESCDTFCRETERLGMRVAERHLITLDNFNPITIIKAQ